MRGPMTQIKLSYCEYRAISKYLALFSIENFLLNDSLVPKERHVPKESNGTKLGVSVVPKESHHDCSLLEYVACSKREL